MDAGPLPFLGIQTLRMQVAEQQAAIQRARLAALEMVDRRQRNERNIQAAKLTIEELGRAAPDSPIGQQKVRMEIAAQQHTIERQILENLEGEQRAEQALERARAAVKSELEYTNNLSAMEEAHGALDEAAFLALIDQLKEG